MERPLFLLNEIATRQLIQFAEISKNRELLHELAVKLQGKFISKTLAHFFSVFRNQIGTLTVRDYSIDFYI